MTSRAELDRLRASREALVSALNDAGAKANSHASLRCPFHNDTHASGSIHQQDGIYYFTCHACMWNGDKHSGDVIDVVRASRKLDFAGAVRHLGTSASGMLGSPTRRSRAREGGSKQPSARMTDDLDDYAQKAVARLTGASSLVDRLWHERAVSRDVAQRFGVGVDADAKYWTFALRDSTGHVHSVKHHRIAAATEPKCFWKPKGTESRHCWPVFLDAPGPVWLVPGELKALAVISAGRSAIGITGGEGVELPGDLAGLIKGRALALVHDDDDRGRKWRDCAVDYLRRHGVEHRIVNIGLDASVGLKDIGDWIVREAVENARELEAIAATLDDRYERSDPWARHRLDRILADPRTWEPVGYIRTGLNEFDEALQGGLCVGGVHLFAGQTGRAKTQSVVQIAANAAAGGVPVCIFSLEMLRRDLGQLIVAQRSRVARSWLSKGTVRENSEPAKRLQRTVSECRAWPMTILDDASWDGVLTRSTLADLVADGCRRLGWRLVVLDYLGLLAAAGDEKSDYDADLKNSAALKRIARKYNVALVCVADIRKGPTLSARAKQLPPRRIITIDDIRGAGRMSYDATNVFYVDCAQTHAPRGEPTGIVFIKALKTRYSGAGAVGHEIQARWYPASGQIVDLEGREACPEGDCDGT